MNALKLLPALFIVTTAGAQLTTAPTLITPPNIQYPPIARAAHGEGQVVVNFSIDSEGRTNSVQTISGPPFLIPAVENQIKQWRFKVPLPVNAQTNFVATYTFTLTEKENLEDDLDAPPFSLCCGDLVILGSQRVTGEVRSADGSQTIDIAPAKIAAKPPCPEDNNRTPPPETRLDDYVELYRSSCTQECSDYLVRVYRNGRVEWHGWHDIALPGDFSAQISSAAAESLLARFQTPDFWSVCSVKLEPRVPEHDPDMAFPSTSITVRIDNHTKSVDETAQSLAESSYADRLLWAIDKTAGTHRWRHGDAATEPYTNMRADLTLPKPGITALIRAIYRISPQTGEQTLEPLKHLLANGVDINAADESGWTALMYAAYLDNTAVLKLLLDAHPNVNHASLHGDTALMISAYGDGWYKNLLAAGADINDHNADGVTTLMLLAQHVDPDELEQALTAKADPRAHDSNGRTALDYLRAASCGKLIIPLPEQWMQSDHKEPQPCPSTAENFLKSQALLQQAMAKPRQQ